MIEVHILIPLSDNTGELFDDDFHMLFEDELDRLFGGSSRLPESIAGRWVDAGRVYRDQNRVYAVFIPGLFEGAPKILETVALAKDLYSQLKVSVRYLGHAEIL